MRFQAKTRHLRIASTMVAVLVVVLVLISGQLPAWAQAGQDNNSQVGIPPVETYVVQVDGPNLTGEVPPLDLSRAQDAPDEVEIVRPTEVYLVPVEGPNLTGQAPPLDKSKAVPLHTLGITPDSYTPGQWYDHYAYYTLDGTEVEQYTNFKETDLGQYIWFQQWENNNDGADRYLYDGWTGYTYNWFDKWLSTTPTLNPGEEYTEGYGTRLQTYFKTNSSSCPCWLADYRVGDH